MLMPLSNANSTFDASCARGSAALTAPRLSTPRTPNDLAHQSCPSKAVGPIRRPGRLLHFAMAGVTLSVVLTSIACRPAEAYRAEADRAAYDIIQQKQLEALGRNEAFTIDRAGDTLRRRLMLEQGLAVATPASLGISELNPIAHWPQDDYLAMGLDQTDGLEIPRAVESPDALMISLRDALQIAAAASRDYQTQKETVYRTALALDLERDAFRSTFSGAWTGRGELEADNGDGNSGGGFEQSLSLGVRQRLINGVDLSTAVALDIAQLLGSNGVTSRAFNFDASISIPLLRGAGAHIVGEALTQAERDAVYAIWDFERFKRTFAVQIASQYLSVLQQQDRVRNAAANYRSAILSSRRTVALYDEGRQDEIQIGQAVQNELDARARWIDAIQSYESSLDGFRVQLGLPPDADVRPLPEELVRVAEEVSELVPDENVVSRGQADPGIDPNEIPLAPPSMEGAGLFELAERDAVVVALTNRLDLRNTIGQVDDAMRNVVVAADSLRAELTLLGRANAGQSRSISSASMDDAGIRFDQGVYDALITLDLPLERTAERNVYRNALITLERSVRDVQELEDDIKQDLRDLLRRLVQQRESVRIQAQAVRLAERRVDSTRRFFELRGDVEVRDVVDAQNDLIDAQNALTNALVAYRVAEWELQRDTGLLTVGPDGAWATMDAESLADRVRAAREAAYDPAINGDGAIEP